MEPDMPFGIFQIARHFPGSELVVRVDRRAVKLPHTYSQERVDVAETTGKLDLRPITYLADVFVEPRGQIVSENYAGKRPDSCVRH